MNDNVTLLLVDDLEKNLVAMEALLRGPGLRVLMARSGDEALELLLANEVALALVDVQMPGMDGFELAELMRGSERTKHVPIVFVTAGAHDRKRQFQGYDSGAVDFLYKPIEPHILTNKVAVFVALFRQKQALARMSVLQSAIFNSANFSSIATDAKGVIQIFNVGAERMLGYKAADVVDKITPANISDPQEVIARATALSVELGTPIAPGFEALVFKASRGIEDIYELTYVRKDGSRFPAVVSVTALRDAQEAIIGYLLICSDNTARKQASQYVRSLLEASLDPLVTISAEGKITDVNEGSIKVTGMAREQLIGTDFSDYFTEPEKAREGYQQVFAKGFVTDYPLTIRHKDGRLTDVLYNASVYKDAVGNVLGVFASARDITEHKRASQYEQSLKEELQSSNHSLAKMNELTSAIVDTTRYPLLVLNAELRVESANQAFFTAFRVPPAATIGRRVYQLGNNQWDIPELRRLLEEILPTNSVLDDFQVTHNFNDIGTRTMLVNARRLHGAQSQPRIVLVLADITEQLRLAKDLKDTADELSRSNAELDQFASVASHDLQEPLRMISNYIELLELRYTALFDDRARGYMRHVSSGAQRMAAMIKAILSYSQIGHQAASFTSFESAVPLHSALANLTSKIQEAEATITEGPLPRINADANQLNQLFQNLLGNALKFRSDKRPQVIHVSAIESNIEWTFAIADNGIGMDKEGCGKIFQLFQRLHNAQQYPGTGIGLATCRKILDHHRGRIWVESIPDVGSTFYFTLPK